MTIGEFNQRLLQGEIVPLTAAEWDGLAGHFKLLERHSTFVVDDLLIVQGSAGLIAVDQPTANKRIIRQLATDEEKDKFVHDRLQTYERMWDGCGCKIDYTK